MRNRVVAFSSKIVAAQKEKPGNALFMRALKKSDSLLKELGFFYEKWYNENERRGIEHAER